MSDTLKQKKDMLDQLAEAMQSLMIDIFLKVLASGGHTLSKDDVISFRAGDQLCEVVCKQGCFVIDRQNEQIVAFTPNPEYRQEVIH